MDVKVDFFRFHEEVLIPPHMINRKGCRHVGTLVDALQRDPKNSLIGMPVTITGKHHLKGYHGFVKDVSATGDLHIELEATLSVVHFRRSHVSIRYFPYYQ